MVTIAHPFAEILMLGFGLWVVAGLLWFIEALSIRSFSARTYRLGPVVLRRNFPRADTRHLPELLSPQGDASSLVYCLLDETSCLFRAKGRLAPMTLLRGLILKGTARVKEATLQIEARLPLMTCLAATGWLTFWLAGALGAGDPVEGWGVALVLLFLTGALLSLFFLVERRRTARAILELRNLIDPGYRDAGVRGSGRVEATG